MNRTAKFGNADYQLEGHELHVGDDAPNFKLHYRGPNGLEDITLDDYAGKTLILSVVPSLDTAVCSKQTKTFNEAAAKLPENIAILTVSNDLPYAQARFCGAEGIDRLKAASDHRDITFGKAYGTVMMPIRIQSRAAFVVGPDRKIKYAEYLPEAPMEPNYEQVLAAAIS